MHLNSVVRFSLKLKSPCWRVADTNHKIMHTVSYIKVTHTVLESCGGGRGAKEWGSLVSLDRLVMEWVGPGEEGSVRVWIVWCDGEELQHRCPSQGYSRLW